MRIISWNLNGLQSCLKHHSFIPIAERSPDILCLQEIRTMDEPTVINGYYHLWNHGTRKGYSGTAALTKIIPTHVDYGFGHSQIDPEGRLLVLEFKKIYVINAYFPNAQQNLERHEYRMDWDKALKEYVCGLMEDKPVIICGDFNVAREDIDIYPENLRQYWAGLGYASDERANFETLLECGFVDAYRELWPMERSYTWWSNRLNKRREDRGWRLDYFLVDERLMNKVKAVQHLQTISGSDHCPIALEVEV